MGFTSAKFKHLIRFKLISAASSRDSRWDVSTGSSHVAALGVGWLCVFLIPATSAKTAVILELVFGRINVVNINVIESSNFCLH